VLDVRNLNVAYGQSQVLHGVDFSVTPGEIVAVVGRNGMGKSTLMKSLIGVIPTRSGQVLIDGGDVTALPSHSRVARGLAYVPQGRQIFGTMSVRENIETGLVVTGKSVIPEEIYTLFPNLKERARTAHGTRLSGGEQQMLAIARILRTGAKMLLLDGPTEGLAPVIVQQIGRTIHEIKNRGFTVLLVEQNFRFAQTVADRHYVVEHGKVIDMIPNHRLEASMDKLHEYLGV